MLCIWVALNLFKARLRIDEFIHKTVCPAEDQAAKESEATKIAIALREGELDEKIVMRCVAHTELVLGGLTIGHDTKQTLDGINKKDADKDDADLDAVKNFANDWICSKKLKESTTSFEGKRYNTAG